ncbi:glycosyl hydrolase family 18 protein [Rothia koreensis]|jgi:chitinase|uniref:glycosyl hydrolase family 18 protein n=1 Tax=Rothia koreensis TaxID=592378 RepID=UPI0015C144AF
MKLSRTVIVSGLLGTSVLGLAGPAAQASEAAPASHEISPYLNVSQSNVHTLQENQAATGVSAATLAFLNARPGSCELQWDAAAGQGPGYLQEQIAQYQQAGGAATISFGGAGNRDNLLAHTCDDVGRITDAYRQVVDTYGVTHLDFDLEQGAQKDDAANQRRNQALAQLQQERPGVTVDYTFPVEPRGLGPDAQGVLSDAATKGVSVNTVNIMTMDFGKEQDTVRSGKYAIDGTNAQLAELYGEQRPGLGVTFSMGESANQQDFTQEDARELQSYAVEQGASKLSYWQLAKDAETDYGYSRTLADLG